MSDDKSENQTLTKSRITDWVYDRLDSTKDETRDYVDAVLDTIKSTAADGEEIKVSGFGKFVVRHKDARVGRNPKTGREVPIPERKVLRFKISQVFKDQLNGDREFKGF